MLVCITYRPAVESKKIMTNTQDIINRAKYIGAQDLALYLLKQEKIETKTIRDFLDIYKSALGL